MGVHNLPFQRERHGSKGGRRSGWPCTFTTGVKVDESGVLGRIGAIVPKGAWGGDTDGGAAAGAGDDDKIVISPPASCIPLVHGIPSQRSEKVIISDGFRK